MLYGLILVIHTFVCFVLIAVILLQAGRGGGLADSFGGGGSQALFGTRGAVYLTRATTACATIFMLTSLILAVLSAQRGRSLMERSPVIKTQPPVQTESSATQESTGSSESADQPTQPSSSEPVAAPSESLPKP